MKIEFDNNRNFFLVIGCLGLLVLLVIGSVLGLLTGLLAAIFRGLLALLRFGFSSIAGFAVLVVVAFFAYRGYKKLTGSKEEEPETVDYSDEDFER